MLKVGLPGAKEGLQARDVTIAELLKDQGYMTAQFGKNHLGDADETLPTAHGFDEFFGSLYHLNAEQEFENEDYFKDPEMVKKFKTRGVLHCWANEDGTQKIESKGALGKKRMETIDDETTQAALGYLEKAKKADKPFFMWWNLTRMHIFTHLKEESKGKTGLGLYPDGMVEHDAHVGQILDKLKELGLDDNTIVMYSTDNGAETFTWPDGGTTPFRGEKNENWEGGYRVPCAMRWPGVIKPGSMNNNLLSHEDMFPTLLAAAGVPDVKEQLLKGMKVGKKSLKSISMATTSPTGCRGRARTRVKSSSTGTTTAPWWRCGTTSGRLFSRSSAVKVLPCWQIHSCRYASLNCLTCVPIHSSAPIRSASVTPNGDSIVRSCSYQRSSSSASTSRRSRNFRPARRSEASRWIKCLTASQRRRPAASSGKDASPVNTLDDRQPKSAAGLDVAAAVKEFYERYPYPPPIDDLDNYRRRWQDLNRRRADFHLSWPEKPFSEERTILIAGCGTSQAAKHAIRCPSARVIGIDVSATSVRHTDELRRKYRLTNLEIHQLPIDRVADLGVTFEEIVCTGVLHHLAKPETALRALRDVLYPDGAMHLIMYTPSTGGPGHLHAAAVLSAARHRAGRRGDPRYGRRT